LLFCFFSLRAFWAASGPPEKQLRKKKNQVNPHVVSLGFLAFLDGERPTEKAKKQINTKNFHWTSIRIQPKPFACC
jgi:hypothetical protein